MRLDMDKLKQPKSRFFYITPRYLRVLGISLFLLLTASYLLVRFIPFFFEPELNLTKPAQETIIVNSSQITIEGKVNLTSSLTLNGERLYIKENGEFIKSVELNEGINRLALVAGNMFGRKIEVVRRVIYIKK